MAFTYSTAAKTARLQAVVDLLDSGSGSAKLEIGTAGMASLLAEFTLPEPCGTVSGDVLTFDFDPDISDSSANNGGTAAEAQIKDGDGNVVISGLTVGVGSGDVQLDSVTITAGQTVTITAGTITHAA